MEIRALRAKILFLLERCERVFFQTIKDNWLGFFKQQKQQKNKQNNFVVFMGPPIFENKKKAHGY